MTAPRSYDEVHAEQVAMARDAVQNAMSANERQQASAGQWLSTGTPPAAEPVKPAHAD